MSALLALTAVAMITLKWDAAIKSGKRERGITPVNPEAEISILEESIYGESSNTGSQDYSGILPPDFFRNVRDQHPLRRVEGGYVTIVEPDLLCAICNRIHTIGQTGLTAAEIPYNYDDFENHPDRLRGKALRVKGRLIRLKMKSLGSHTDCVVTELWEGTILDDDQCHYNFYALKRDPGLRPGGDTVEAMGVFFKNIRYPTRGGSDLATPLIIALDVKKITAWTGRTDSGNRLHVAVLVISCAIVILVVGGILLERRRRRNFWNTVG